MKLSETTNVLKTASGEELKIRGQINLTFTFGSKVFVRPTIVVEGLKSKVIIGNDTMRSVGFILDPARQRILIRPPTSNFPVLIKKAYTIEAGQEQLVDCIFDTTEDLTDIDLMATDDIKDPVLNQSLEIVEGLFRGNQSKNGSIVLANTSSEDVYIPKRSQLGRMHTTGGYEIIELVEETAELIKDAVINKNPRITINDIDLSQIPVEFRSAYLGLCNKYKDIFAWKDVEVGNADIIKHKIILKDPDKVASVPPYRLNPNLREIADKYVDKLLGAGIIRKSTSPFSSPLLLVKKAHADDSKPLDQSWRVCHDYRRLNFLTVKDSYPLQNIHDLIDSVSQAEIWSVIDLSHGFWNQSMDESSKAFTAFSVPGKGHYEYNKSSMGLTNSPAAFQRLLDYILRGLKRTFCYIDDIVIASKSHPEHLVDLDALFERFRKYKMKLRVSKLQLATREINYLGFNISKAHGIRAGLSKTHAIEAWTPPESVTQIKQFLGLAGFFRKTIKDFSNIAQAMNKLTRADSKWKTGEMPPAALEAFQTLKKKLCARPCLKPVDFSRPFIITCDASTLNGLGALLSQDHDGVEHPCGYASKSLSEPEKKYSPYHLERLAILWAIRQFRNYVYGRHFTVRTDHKPLLSLNNMAGLQLERIRTELMEYEPFTVKYIQGEKNPADGLSRNPPEEQVESVYEVVHDGDARGQEVWGSALNWAQIYHLQKEDAGIKALVCALKFGSRPLNANLNEFINKHVANCKIVNGVVCYATNTENKERNKFLVFAPRALIPTLLDLSHDNPLAGHFATAKTYQRLRTQWHWDGMIKDVQNYCNSCVICGQTNRRHDHRPAPLESLPSPDKFGYRLNADLFGPLPLSGLNNMKYLLVMTDAFTNLVALHALRDKTADVVAKGILDGWVSHHGCPGVLATDRGSEFAAGVTKELCDKLNIKQRFSSVAHPQSNGRVERFNKVIIAYYQKYLDNNPQWEALLPALQFSYNSAPHSSTGYSPFFKAFMRRPVVPSSLLNEPVKSYSEMESAQGFSLLHQVTKQIKELQQEAFDRQKAQFDKRSVLREFKEGDYVYTTASKKGKKFQKFQRAFNGPYIITKLLGHNNVEIWREGHSKKEVCHANRLKLCVQRDQNLVLTGQNESNYDDNNDQRTDDDDPARQTLNAFQAAVPLILDDDDPLPDPPPPPPLLQFHDGHDDPIVHGHDEEAEADDGDDANIEDEREVAIPPTQAPPPRPPPPLSPRTYHFAPEADVMRQIRPAGGATGAVPR